jgi:hypothetical protein
MSLLDLPRDVIRIHILGVGIMPRCLQIIYRTVCKLFYKIIPPLLFKQSGFGHLTANCLAYYGYTELLNYLFTSSGYLPTDSGICNAAISGYLDTVKWSLNNGLKYNSLICRDAAKHGRLNIIKWLKENSYPISSRTLGEAAGGGYLNIMEYIVNNVSGTILTADLYHSAISGNQMHIIKWLKENNCPMDDDMYTYAIIHKHIHILQWIHENGRRFNANACRIAAMHNNLDTLKWLRANGCPWDSNTCFYALVHKHMDVLEWAHENGCPWNPTEHLYLIRNCPVILEWGRRIGLAGLDQPLEDAVVIGDIEDEDIGSRGYDGIFIGPR